MRIFLILLLTFGLLVNPTYAQFFQPVGARAQGMANAVVTVSDEWSPFHNVSGIVGAKSGLGIWYKTCSKTTLSKETSVHGLWSFKKAGTCASFYRFGNDVFRLTKISIGGAHSIGMMRLGIQVHWVQVAIEELGVKSVFCFDFGGTAELVPSKLFFGATLFNGTQTKLDTQPLPILMKAGLSYRPNRKCMLNAEVENELDFATQVKFGVEYSLTDYVKLRTGFSTQSFTSCGGLGIGAKVFQLEYALTKHPQLGFSHQISLFFILPKRK